MNISLRQFIAPLVMILATVGGMAAPFPWVCSFDGDNAPDPLWHYKGNSLYAPWNVVWLMSGTGMDPESLVTSTDPEWSMVGTGKFHTGADSNRDIVWRHDSSNLAVAWIMNGLTHVSNTYLDVPSGADGVNWRIAATADLTADGYTDIVWEHKQTGSKAIYLMQGGACIGVITLPSNYNSWRVMTAGDFGSSAGNSTPDSHADLVLYSIASSGVGSAYIWYLQWNGTTVVSLGAASLAANQDGDWKPLLAGDVDGDGKTDILLYHATMGMTTAWRLNGVLGLGIIDPFGAHPFDTDWKLVGQGNQESSIRTDPAVVSLVYRPQLWATPGAGASINLTWSHPGTTFSVWRKLTTEASWGLLVSGITSTTWSDSTVQYDRHYDYRITATGWDSAPTVSACVAHPSIASPIVTRGRAIVIVDSTKAAALQGKLDQLRRDLVVDGWDVPNLTDLLNTANYTVPRHVDHPDPPAAPVPNHYTINNYPNVLITRNLIRSWLNPGVANVAWLIGHVPVPYSGYKRSDGHSCCKAPPDHGGAWACDMVYTTPNTAWSDSGSNSQQTCADVGEPWFSNYTNCYWEENSNHAGGDGKYDLDEGPGSLGTPMVEVAVGRIDFSRMSPFEARGVTETQLLQNYFDKIHRFRYNLPPYGAGSFQPKGVLMNFPSGGELTDIRADAGRVIRKMSSLYGGSSVVAGDPFRQNQSKCFEWGFAIGFGLPNLVYDGTTGEYTTSLLATSYGAGATPESRIGFYSMFGSYFGDFDKRENLMRAAIATPNYGFAAMWHMDWNLDSMAIGEHLGSVLSRTFDSVLRYRELAIMGDPTLRLCRVPAPGNVTWNGTTLSWTPVGGTMYHVYGSNNPLVPFTTLVTNTTSGSCNPTGYSSYQLRAVRRVFTASSGSYWEISQGVVKP